MRNFKTDRTFVLMILRYPGDDRWKEVSLYGDWQTERYRPATAQDGVVPRNEFGNVEMFKPWMLPVGCSHVDLPGEFLEINLLTTVLHFHFSGRFPLLSNTTSLKLHSNPQPPNFI